ncbi:hypothetical protein [uncultured Clostridium sp.]|uniref:hypothetical protein n=1 Tax=uncultured Clostridium sp. TaxID=59620 RepID=UPI00261F9816|nr:hypothetical protein [uncultured Clostridium sp.]
MISMKNELLNLNRVIDELCSEKNNFSEKEIEKRKKNLKRTFKKYYDSKNISFSIDVLDLDKINIETFMSKRNEKYELGVCNIEVLKILACYGTSKLGILQEETLYQKIFKWDVRKKFTMNIDELCYISLIITSKEVIAYELDNYFRVIRINRNFFNEIGEISFNPYCSYGKRVRFIFSKNNQYNGVSFNCETKEYNEIFKILVYLKPDIVRLKSNPY